MKADDGWLSDPSRTFPAYLDPSISWVDPSTERFSGAAQDCYLYGGSHAGVSTCAFTGMAVGQSSSPARGVLRFDVSSIPSNAVVSGAQLSLYQDAAYASSASITSRVHTIASDWDNNASWNNRKTGAAWTTAGGDMSTTASLTGSPVTAVGAGNTWFHWPLPAAAIKGWVAGTLPNYGLELSADNETANMGSLQAAKGRT